MLDPKAYIKNKGLICPYCGADSLQGSFIEVQQGQAFQEMRCTQCEATWQDIYKLVFAIAH